jgi:predicted MPP superfamily phosphohydrolase
VLEHSPDVVPAITGKILVSNDLKLYLAGHTHGGQVWFPILGTPIVPSFHGQKYSYGHARDADLDIFVTSGIGTSILPIRFMMPPEIAVLTVNAE